MISEIIPDFYDPTGIQVSQPFLRRKGPHPSVPMGRYVSQPLAIKCKTIGELRTFLSNCRYVSDEEQFGKRDFWQPPEDFEKGKKGDCEDFALWAWRQLLGLGYDARFVVGAGGRYGAGHAWVEYFQEGRCYLVEPLASRFGYTLPRLFTLKYVPKFSVSWDGEKLRYFAHNKPDRNINWWTLSPLVLEYLPFWAFLQLTKFVRIPRIVWQGLRKSVSK